ncbi:MAG: PorT family protein [Bacteroidetes bacterium]|nr:PorT family protein [Bacteroidota bacterium]
MRKYILAALCSTLYLTVHAESSKEKYQQTVQLSVNFGSGIAYHTYKATAHTPIEGMVTSNIWDKDKITFGYNAGLNVTWQFHKNVAFEGGISYMLRGWQWRQDSVWFATSFPPQYDSIYSLKAKDNYHYINIPLKLKFYAGKGKVKFVGGVGVSLDFLIGTSQTSTLSYHGKTVQRYDAAVFPARKFYNVFNVSALASAGIDYAISHKYGIRVEPYFSHQCMKINKQGSIYGYLWNAGINWAFYFGVK